MRMRLRLRKVWANHHPILGATYTQRDGISSGPSSANLSAGDLDDAPKIDPTNLYLDYSTLTSLHFSSQINLWIRYPATTN